MNDRPNQDKRSWIGRIGLRWSLSFALYFLASAIGFFYVDAYYGYEEFGIDILSHVESLDLLFISIEHIDKVLFVALGGLIGILLVFLLVAILGGISVLMVAAFTLVSALIFLGSVATDRINWLWLALSAVLADRTERRRKMIGAGSVRGGSEKVTDSTPRDLNPPLSFTEAYGEAKKEGSPRYMTTEDFLKDADKFILDRVLGLERTDQQRGTPSRFVGLFMMLTRLTFDKSKEKWIDVHWKPWKYRVAICLFTVYLVFLTKGIGIADAETVSESTLSCEFTFAVWSGSAIDNNLCYLEKVWRGIVGLMTPIAARNSNYGADVGEGAEEEDRDMIQTRSCTGSNNAGQDGPESAMSNQRRRTVYAIPTGNLASMSFVSSCSGGNTPSADGVHLDSRRGNRKYVRPYFRHDAGEEGRPNTPSCLKYLGSTGRMHFLMDINDSKASRGSMGTGTVCDLVTWVGPFETGSASEFGKGSEADEPDGGDCGEAIGSVLGADRVHVSESVDSLLERARERSQSAELERVILVGRADSRRIYNASFRSNLGLAQARANWVWGQLRAGLSDTPMFGERVYTMSVVGGPAYPGSITSACDRGVEIHMCWKREKRRSGAGCAEPFA